MGAGVLAPLLRTASGRECQCGPIRLEPVSRFDFAKLVSWLGLCIPRNSCMQLLTTDGATVAQKCRRFLGSTPLQKYF